MARKPASLEPLALELLHLTSMKTILLVDNDRFNRAIATCALSAHQEFQLVSASNYLEALWTLCVQEVDLVIAHLEMPEQEGLDLLTYLATYRPWTPVLTMSSRKQTAEGDPSSGRAHVSTPLQPHMLLAQVHRCLRSAGQGKLRPLGLLDLLRVLRLEKKTCILKVKASFDTGQILFSSGRIIHAGWGHIEGEAAVRHMLNCETSWFRVEAVPTRLSKRLDAQLPVTGMLA